MKKQLLLGAFSFSTCANALFAQSITTVEMGRSSGICSDVSTPYLATTPTQLNPLVYDPQSGLLLFLHKQDVTIWGGGGSADGKFRYDISTDGGGTFTTDIGTLQQIYTRKAFLPQAAIFNPNASTNPLDQKLVYLATTLDPSPAVEGFVAGVSDITDSGTPTATENYVINPSGNTYVLSSLAQAAPGVFFTVEHQYDGANYTGNIQLYKGVWNSGTSDVDWSAATVLQPTFDMTYDGSIHFAGIPMVAFAPDGQKGWLAFAADVFGDTTKSPVFYKTVNGGTTWTGPFNVNMAACTWASPVQYRRTLTHDYDLSVDADGNPHLAASVWMQNEPNVLNYQPAPQFGGRLMDITSPDGGTTWEFKQIAPLLTYETEYYCAGNPGDLYTYNFVQCARDAQGEHIFYSWADSDTILVNGGIGFGEINNLAPNLRISALRVDDGYRTCVKRLADSDLLWSGRITMPYMSPIVMSNQGNFELPIVFAEATVNDFAEAIAYHYAGNSAQIHSSEFEPFNDYSIDWMDIVTDTCANNVSAQIQPESNVWEVTVFPNPAQQYVQVQLSGDSPAQTTISLLSLQGQIISQQTSFITNGVVSLDTKQLPAGLYLIHVVNEQHTSVHKVSKE